jgi:membrane protein YdbS with pleckstrin-like domain
MRFPTRGGAGPAAVSRYLLPREEQRILTRRHVAVLIGPVVLLLAGFLAALSLSTTVLSGNEFLTIAVWFGVAVLAARLIWKFANWLVDYFVVTSQRMLLTTGLLSRKVAMMPLSKVTDMSFRRSFAGRLLGYGEFIVESAGQDQALRTVDHLPYPEHLYLEVCGMLFPIKDKRCPMCQGERTIWARASAVLAEVTVDEGRLGVPIPLPDDYQLPGEFAGTREFLLSGEHGPARGLLIAAGYSEFVCPRCDGEGRVPADSDDDDGT